MAIVAVGTTSSGVKYRIRDDAYILNTPEKNEALRRRACEIAHSILVQNAQQGGAEQCRESQE